MQLVALVFLLMSAVASVSAQSARDQRTQPAIGDASELPSSDALPLLLEQLTAPQTAYELGVQLFQAQRYQDAEKAWLRAYSLGRDPKLLVAVADIRQRQGDAPGTVASLERYLVERPDAPDRASIEARIATLRESPARLFIRSEEPGLAILLDGVPIPQRTPASLTVDPGVHTVIAVGDGKQVGEQTVEVGYGEERELRFSMRMPSAEPTEETRLEKELAAKKDDTTIRRAVIGTGAISGAALISGTVLSVVARRKEQNHGDASDTQAADQRERLRLFANLSFGIAALSAITSFTLFMTHKNQPRQERETARLRIELRGIEARATLRF